MTRQEIFNKAYLGLKSQGFKQSEWAGSCKYNGPNNTHCAIGWVIPDLPENYTIGAIAWTFPEKLIGVIAENLEELDQLRPFLQDLQIAHDGYDPQTMKWKLERLAKMYELEIPE